MSGARKYVTLVLVVLSSAFLACQRMDRDGLGPDLERGLAGGRAFATQLAVEARTDPEVSPATAVALGYLERLRLGLGSPFRLIDHALRDPRLADSVRVRLGWALLARTLDGDAYDVDPAALARAAVAGTRPTPVIGRAHAELISSAIREARDPRGGELAVRLAYALAAAEGSVGSRGAMLAAQAAALYRDRELARRDALELLRAAEAERSDPLALLSAWRAERRFSVEAPSLRPLPAASEQEAMELAPRLAAAIRSLAPRLGANDGSPARMVAAAIGGRGESASFRRRSSWLTPNAAAALAAVADSFNAPPQAPIVVAVDMYRRELVPPTADAPGSDLRRGFAERARNEERFAAEYALLMAGDSTASVVGAMTALAAAVGMRTHAQEEVWFPGFGGPSRRELEERFGLASITFADDVPAAWRPYYRRMLEQALSDLNRVLPSLSVRGLRVHFGQSDRRGGTLALHDPTRRTIYLPPATGSGTIAHEVAHDLDWQVALQRYRVRGDYATDRATRGQRDRLAVSLRGLTTASLLAPEPGDRTPPEHSRRPAEVFARNVDWFVVVALASEGRMNGYLSSVQDDVLTGYGTVTPPDVTGAAGAALIAILDEVAPVHPETREMYLIGYGPNRALTPYDLVRRVVEANMPGHEPTVRYVRRTVAEDGDALRLKAASDAATWFAHLERARDAAFATIEAWGCRAPGASYDRHLEAARRRLVAEAVGARARGVALEYSELLAGSAGRRWVARELYGPPWPTAQVDEATVEVLAELVARVRALDQSQPPSVSRGFNLAAAHGYCADAPLLAD